MTIWTWLMHLFPRRSPPPRDVPPVAPAATDAGLERIAWRTEARHQLNRAELENLLAGTRFQRDLEGLRIGRGRR